MEQIRCWNAGISQMMKILCLQFLNIVANVRDLKISVKKKMQIASTIMMESVWDMLIN